MATTQTFKGGFAVGSASHVSVDAAIVAAVEMSKAAGVSSVAVWDGLTKVASVTAGVVTRCNVPGNTTICAYN